MLIEAGRTEWTVQSIAIFLDIVGRPIDNHVFSQSGGRLELRHLPLELGQLTRQRSQLLF
jgi:hypothetical protein